MQEPHANADDLETRFAKATDELTVLRARISELEREKAEGRVASEFAHELRNCLVGPRLLVAEVLQGNRDRSVSAPIANGMQLREFYEQTKNHLGAHDLERMRTTFRSVLKNEEYLDSALRVVYDAISRGLSMTQQLLDYAKAGRDLTGEVDVDVNDAVRAVLREASHRFTDTGLELATDLEREVTTVKARETDVHSVVRNLVLNACDAFSEGRSPSGETACVRVSTHRTRDHVVLSVKDNATGIPLEDLPRIFEPFFSTKREKGTGLGLPLVKKIVAMYGGEVFVDSVVGRGSTFEASFRRSERTSRETDETVPRERRPNMDEREGPGASESFPPTAP